MRLSLSNRRTRRPLGNTLVRSTTFRRTGPAAAVRIQACEYYRAILRRSRLRRRQQERLEQNAASEPRASASAAAKPQNGFEFSTPQNQADDEPDPTPEPAQPDQISVKTEATAA